jgi:hypothetical protein
VELAGEHPAAFEGRYEALAMRGVRGAPAFWDGIYAVRVGEVGVPCGQESAPRIGLDAVPAELRDANAPRAAEASDRAGE